MKFNSLLTLWSVAAIGSATLHKSYEQDDEPIIRHDGDPVGKEETYNNRILSIPRN